MNVFSYVIEHDLGFAPNPFHRVCTLACCKQRIRKKAQVGDMILGMGAAKPKLKGHLCYWMRVDEILTFDEYWEDIRFRSKRPQIGGSTYLQYGDNIYHRDGDVAFKQEDSFHSEREGKLSQGNLHYDTGTTEKVLISSTFTYWGGQGVKVPDHLKRFTISGPNHKSKFSPAEIDALMQWLNESPERGYRAEPAHWQFLVKKRRPKT